MFGLRGVYSNLTKFIDNDGDMHLSRIKVWTADIPEPSDAESGHGTYDETQSKFVYSDKYHSEGEYNPDA